MNTVPDTSLETRISSNLREIQQRIESAASRAGRRSDEVTLIAVSKTVDREAVDAAYRAGARDFGENRVQDALDKFTGGIPSDMNLHMIGTLQTNKVRQIVGHTALIHSVDRASLIKEIEKRAASAGIEQAVLLQVNVGHEEQKHGCDEEEVPALIEQILAQPHVQLRGFMAMAPLVESSELARPVFACLRELAQKSGAQYPEIGDVELSMGMTNDFEVAVEEGATLVRIGRAVFATGGSS